jgi:hypothetical protein
LEDGGHLVWTTIHAPRGRRIKINAIVPAIRDSKIGAEIFKIIQRHCLIDGGGVGMRDIVDAIGSGEREPRSMRSKLLDAVSLHRSIGESHAIEWSVGNLHGGDERHVKLSRSAKKTFTQ